VQQGKTGTKLRIEIIGDLAQTIARIMVRKATHKVRSLSLVVNEHGQALTYSALDGRFGKARKAAGIGTHDFQFRDLRAKAGTEIEGSRGMEEAQGLLGHANASMTSHYVRHRKGKLVKPTR
jgi:integrase